MLYSRGKNESKKSKEEYLSLAAARYNELQQLNQPDNFYDYEKEFISIWRALGQRVLERTREKP